MLYFLFLLITAGLMSGDTSPEFRCVKYPSCHLLADAVWMPASAPIVVSP